MKKKQSFYYFYGKKKNGLLRIMKLLVILLTMTCMTISANTFSQQQRVTLEMKNVGAMELFKEIQKKTNLYVYICFYERNKILSSPYLIVVQWFTL